MTAVPDVTVVVVAYNHAPFIEGALESAYGQTYPQVSVIVTDDASTDDSQDVIRRVLDTRGWSARTILHAQNRGLCPTLNEAVAACETEYIALIAADDLMVPHRIATQVRMLEEAGPQFAVACSDVALINQDGSPNPGSIVSPAALAAPWGRDGFFEALLAESLVMAPSALIRTSALRAIGGYDESLAFEDWDAWLRLARAGYRFVRTDEQLVQYRIVDSSLWRSLEGTPRYRLAEIKLLGKHLDHSPAVEAQLTPRLYHHAVQLYKAGFRDPAVQRTLLHSARRTRDPRALAYGTLATLGVPWPGRG